GGGDGEGGGGLPERAAHGVDPAGPHGRRRGPADAVRIRPRRPQREIVGRRVRQPHVVTSSVCPPPRVRGRGGEGVSTFPRSCCVSPPCLPRKRGRGAPCARRSCARCGAGNIKVSAEV